MEKPEEGAPAAKEAKEKGTITKEVLTTPCSRCGGLVLQAAAFRPHCGAQREG